MAFEIAVVIETGGWNYVEKAGSRKGMPAKNAEILCALCELSLRPPRETFSLT